MALEEALRASGAFEVVHVGAVESNASADVVLNVRESTGEGMLSRDVVDHVLLTSREREILGLLSDGYSTDEVAEKLSLSAHTVRTHVKNAMRKLDASGRRITGAEVLDRSLRMTDPTAAALAGDVLYYLAAPSTNDSAMRSETVVRRVTAR